MNRIERMKQLRKKGLSYGSIGKVFEISRQRVHQLITDYITPDIRIKCKNRPDIKKLKMIYDYVFKRDNWTCQKCEVRHKELLKLEKRDRIIIHHIDNDWKNSNPNNLICLCNKCHLNLHRPSNNINLYNSRKGCHHTEETKKRMSIAQKKRKRIRNIKVSF